MEVLLEESFSPVAGIKCVDRFIPESFRIVSKGVSVPLPGLSVLIASLQHYIDTECLVSVPLPGLSVLIAQCDAKGGLKNTVSVPLPGLSVLIDLHAQTEGGLKWRFSPVAGIKCVDRSLRLISLASV